MDSRVDAPQRAPPLPADGVLPWEAIIARWQLTARFHCQRDRPSSSGFLWANNILNTQIKLLTSHWLLSKNQMVPFVPLDNAPGIRRIQRRPNKEGQCHCVSRPGSKTTEDIREVCDGIHSWDSRNMVGHFDQLVDCTAEEMKSDSLQLAGVVLMEPFKSRIAPVSENTANTPADVISQLLPQSGQVPPRLSESQRDAFRATRSCSIKSGEPFEAPCLRWYSCDPAASYQVSKGLLFRLLIDSPPAFYYHYVESILAFFSLRRAPHGRRTHATDKRLSRFDNRCQRDPSLTVRVCARKARSIPHHLLPPPGLNSTTTNSTHRARALHPFSVPAPPSAPNLSPPGA
ncbi:unnamed protein product [Pleuronectes platessa]|uniref:Uncharacterized protein n=1 Tax=Pleuronectes platessa TaxID=8262 RepID=A0A9N7Z1N3_PLEPL|nr:unnamed protein product [Pleuronectes platessa]